MGSIFMKRVKMGLCLAGALGCAAFAPSDSAPAEAAPGGNACSAFASAASGDLLPVWQSAPQVLKWACNKNPERWKLFQGQPYETQTRKLRAYCELDPVLRLCVVCSLKSRSAPDIASAFGQCGEHLHPGSIPKEVREALREELGAGS